jgi:hypothetical protein
VGVIPAARPVYTPPTGKGKGTYDPRRGESRPCWMSAIRYPTGRGRYSSGPGGPRFRGRLGPHLDGRFHVGADDGRPAAVRVRLQP